MSILQKLHEDEGARGAFQDILSFLLDASDPERMEVHEAASLVPDSEMVELRFNSYLEVLISLKRSMDVQEDAVKIGHWCLRELEKSVKNMESNWSIYWLTLRYFEGIPAGIGLAVTESKIHYSIWAVGKDDNSVRKGITTWAETHFGQGTVIDLKCVRR